MHSSRRSFLASMSGAAAAAPMFHPWAVRRLRESWAIAGDRGSSALADDESYWSTIQRAFDLDRSIVNLNNGGVCPSPTHVLDQMIRDLRFWNEIPAEHMWRVLEPRIETVRAGLAEEFGCDPEEMA
ncbi:MAG TPA: hypothetical protein VFM12_06720, partial [Gemmatimonadales bacterium]|nr:hypothetical protein [Gemmatimonadales bacterium]